MDIRYFNRSETNKLQIAIHDIWTNNHIFCRSKKMLDYMFYENPSKNNWVDSENYSFLGVWVENRVVGILGVMPFELNFRGKQGIGCCLTNWMVLPEYRNTGAGLALFHKIQGYQPEIILSLGINQTIAKLYRKMNWQILDSVPRWIGVVNKWGLEKLYEGRKSTIIYCDEISVIITQNSYQFSNQLREEGWNKFYQGDVAPITSGIRRDYQFLEWRYMKHPEFIYQFITCEDKDGNYKGMAVVRIECILNTNEKIGRILEFIAIDKDSSFHLANEVVKLDQEVLFWDYYCFSSIGTWGLESIGFKCVLDDDSGLNEIPSLFQPLDLTVTNIMAAYLVEQNNLMDDWYITKGDSDQDRPN